MIITNSIEKPTIRFLEVVRPYFESQGYDYHKTKKQFQRPFTKGTQYVGFWFRIGILTSVCLNWRFQFEKLEKYTTPYFNQHNEYSDLYEFYFKQNWRQTREIILAKYLLVTDHEQIICKFQQEVYDRKDKEEMALCDKTIHFLNTQNLKHWLD
jgi:hypothetical protein